MLDHADAFLLDRVFQPTADWMQRRFERDTFWLSRLCLHAVAVLTFSSNLIEVPATDQVVVFNLFVTIMVLTGVVMGLGVVSDAAAQCRRHPSCGNPMRMKLAWPRRTGMVIYPLAFLATVVGLHWVDRIEAYQVLLLPSLLLWPAYLFFVSCSPWPKTPARAEMIAWGAYEHV